uniref:DNA polymerase III, chi subunit n=1 Tax=Candidatus Kentrum sp. DK TaxID=2126562 RepID=A0A450T565_9GAMM|nr:MAG: DNA polymerase III, chi subunit [Candidatus Kentron sp. DK]
MSPRVDFYILETAVGTDIPHMACRITEKAWKSGFRVFIHTGARFTAAKMDELLWSFRAESFVPHTIHATAANEDKYPVLIGTGADPGEALDVVINLGDDTPPFLLGSNRVVEIVAGNARDRESGRQRYRLYREKGCSLHTHRL